MPTLRVGHMANGDEIEVYNRLDFDVWVQQTGSTPLCGKHAALAVQGKRCVHNTVSFHGTIRQYDQDGAQGFIMYGYTPWVDAV